MQSLQECIKEALKENEDVLCTCDEDVVEEFFLCPHCAIAQWLDQAEEDFATLSTYLLTDNKNVVHNNLQCSSKEA